MILSEKRKRHLKFVQQIRLWSFLSFVAFLFITLTTVEHLLVSSVLALVINYMLGPIVNYLERAGVHRLISTLLVFTLGGVIVGFTLTSVAPFLSNQFMNFQTQIPKYIEGLEQLATQVEFRIQQATGISFKTDFSAELKPLVSQWTRAVFEDLPIIVSKLGATILLSPFLAFFLIKDGRLFSKTFLSIVPNHIFELTLNMYYQINDQVGQFVRARLLEALIVGGVVWVGLWMIGFPFAGLLSIFAGITNLIPYIGPFIGAVPALIISIINGDTAFTFFALCAVYGTAQLIDMFFIIPLVVAKLVNLHPVTVVIAMIVGAQVLGVLGMIISIPVASALKVTITSVYKHLVEFRS